MKNILKRIWNFINRKFDSIWDGFTDASILDAEEHLKRLEDNLSEIESQRDIAKQSKAIEHKVEQLKSHTQLFRNQQLPGKIYNTGKSRFRIHDLISTGNKFKYDTERLI